MKDTRSATTRIFSNFTLSERISHSLNSVDYILHRTIA